MGKIELSIKNPFVTKSLRFDRKPTVFKRVFNRLAVEGKHPGNIIPIFAQIKDDYKIFGAITRNIGGSVSFFPDFYGILEQFDHLTLNGNFIQKKGHLTKVESGSEHKKTVNLEASKMANGGYHLITFGMTDGDLLMDSTPEIKLPEIVYTSEEERLKYNTWLNESISGGGPCVLEFPEVEGAYFVQVQILPRKDNINGAVERTFIEKLISKSSSLENANFQCKIIEIPTSEKSDFSILVLTFKVLEKLEGPFGFIMGQDPSKPLLKSM